MFKAIMTGKWIQIVALVAIAGGLAWSAFEAQVYVDNGGVPFNSPGKNCACPRCHNIWTQQLGHYDYYCDKCGNEYACRLDQNKRHQYYANR